MFLLEQEELIFIIKQFPKMGITYERMESDLIFITGKTLRNYSLNITKPKGKKFNFLIKALPAHYPAEYKAAKAKFEETKKPELLNMTLGELFDAANVGF